MVVAALVMVWALMALPAPGSDSGSDATVENSLYGWVAELGDARPGAGRVRRLAPRSALAGGFVAKEVVVGQLAQSYAVTPARSRPGSSRRSESTLDDDAPGGTRAGRARTDGVRAGLHALRRDSRGAARILGTRWTVAAVGAQLAVAWVLAVAVFQLGRLWW